MPERMTCGEALIDLLTRYGVDTVFGIPGVHTLDFCRGLAGSTIRHVQARNIPLVGVEGINPDFQGLARSCGCHAAAPSDEAGFVDAVAEALSADKPTVIEVREGRGWLA